MKKIGIILSLILVIACTTAFTPASKVTPKPPNVWKISIDNTVGIGAEPYCNFEVTEHRYGTWVFTTYYDKNGFPTTTNWDSTQLKASFSANGKTVVGQTWGGVIFTWKPDFTGTAYYYGPSNLLTLPNYGYVYGHNDIEISNMTWSWDSTTPPGFSWSWGPLIKDVGYNGSPNWPAICAYFAP